MGHMPSGTRQSDLTRAEVALLGKEHLRATKQLEREVKRMEHEIAAMHKTTEAMEATYATARQFLANKQFEYAQLHFEGAQVAAAKGDTRPAEWALTHVKAEGQSVVEPPAKVAADTGVKVFLGIKIGGVPEDAMRVETISYESAPVLAAEANNE